MYLRTKKRKFPGQDFQKLEHHRQTDRRTDRCNRTHYHAAFTGGKIT